MTHTIRACLVTIGVDIADLQDVCSNLEQEFSFIKKMYFKKVLVCHPDKGGDAEVFRQVHASFEVLRDLYDKQQVTDSFATDSVHVADDDTWQDFCNMPPQSWEFYYEAAEQPLPLYRVEPAKSGRSACKQKGKAKKCAPGAETIEKGEVRVGSRDDIAGAYARWSHLACWRVPSKVWLGCPDPRTCSDPEEFEQSLLSMNEVLLSGFSDLSLEQRRQVVDHVMEQDESRDWNEVLHKKKGITIKDKPWLRMVNWSLKVVRKPKSDVEIVATDTQPAAASESYEVVPQGYHVPRERFVAPAPGKEGAEPGVLKGKTFVLTGVFPELGGGSGLELGKARAKALIEQFGGRVTGSISGKTDILVVGKDPGASKVTKAEASGKCKLISLKDLKEVIEGGNVEQIAARPMVIPSFSAGYPRRVAIENYAGTKALALEGGYGVFKPATASDDAADRKPAAKISSRAKKRRADDGVAKKPAARRRKAIASIKNPEERKPASRKTVSKKEKERGESFAEKITCDACNKDCTERSWFLEATSEDFCFACLRNEGKVDAGVKQVNGVTV